jgi:predicted ATPase
MQAASNLPQQPTDLLGRSDEIAELRELLCRHRTVTLVGPGGTGKTRLAVAVAETFVEEYDGRVWFVDLAAVGDPELVPAVVATVLDVRVEPGLPADEALAEAVGSQEALLVLDNCEHVLATTSALAGALSSRCSGLRLLATSREALRFAAEITYPVSPLGESPALELFADRAARAVPGFSLAGETEALVAEMCRRLDRLPLAIELTAPALRVLGVRELSDRIGERLRAFERSGGEGVERHRTLHAVVDWSHDLLSEDERVLLRRLAVFQGGFSLDAAEHICGHGAVLDGLVGLVDRSLLVKEERDGRARFRLLETIRHFALEKLQAAGDEADARERHSRWFSRLAEGAEEEGNLVPQRETLDRLATDHANLRVAFDWTLGPGGAPDLALQLAGDLFVFWYIRGHLTEGRAWLEAALSAAPATVTRARAKALGALGELAREQGDYSAAEVALSESLEMSKELGVDVGWGGTIHSLYNLGALAWERGRLEEARTTLGSCDALARERWRDYDGWTRLKLGQVALDEGDATVAHERIEESLALHREHGNAEGIARALDWLGRANLAKGEVAPAELLAEQSLATARELGYREGEPGPLTTLARGALLRDDVAEARRLYEEVLGSTVELGSKRGVTEALEGLARVTAREGAAARAVRIFGAAAALRADLDSPMPGHLRGECEQDLAGARAALEPAAARGAWSAGTALTRAEAMEDARGTELPGPPGADWAPHLTREGEYWTIAAPSGAVRLKETAGVRYLAYLLEHPSVEIHVLDLLRATEGEPDSGVARVNRREQSDLGLEADGLGHAGEMLDAKARASYQRRLDELTSEIDEADRFNDPERAASARTERDALVRELARAFDLHGRPRKAAAADEKARVKVTKAIRGCFKRIAEHDEELARELETAIRTGMYCAYRPERAR